jgi:hypothetical protein
MYIYGYNLRIREWGSEPQLDDTAYIAKVEIEWSGSMMRFKRD